MINAIRHSGVAQAGTAYGLTLSSEASAANDAYKNMVLRLIAGAGSIQERTIASYIGSTKVVSLKGNLLRYSEQINNAVWQKRGTVVVTANNTIAPNGLLEADKVEGVNSGGAHDIWQAVAPLTAGIRYEPSFYIKKISVSGSLVIYNPAHTVAGEWHVDLSKLGNGWERITRDHPAVTIVIEFVVYSNTGYGIHIAKWSGTGDLSFYLWGAQVDEGTVSNEYQANAYIAGGRWDSNLLTYSEQIGTSPWAVHNGVGYIINYTPSPTGTLTASYVSFPQTTSGERIDYSLTNPAVIGETWVGSVWLKGSGTISLNIGTTAGGDETEKTITLTSEWVRHTVIFIVATASGTIRFIPAMWRTGNTANVAYVWGAQVEKGDVVGSYIKAASTAVATPGSTTVYEIQSDKISSEVQKLNAGSLIDLFELDATAIGGQLLRFHAGVNELGNNVVWQGNIYSRFPIEVDGFEWSGQGTMPRPKIRVANITGLIGAYVYELDDLVGAKVTRKRTFLRYLDAVNFAEGNVTADPNAHFSDEVYFIDRKSTQNRIFIEFDLAASWDIQGVKLPRRQCIQNVCTWGYRSAECSYAGNPVATIYDTPIQFWNEFVDPPWGLNSCDGGLSQSTPIYYGDIKLTYWLTTNTLFGCVAKAAGVFAANNVLSVYCKKGTGSKIRINLYDPIAALSHSIDINFTAGGIASLSFINNIDGYALTDLGGGIYRVYIYVDGTARGIVGHARKIFTYPDPNSTGQSSYYGGVQLDESGNTPAVDACGKRLSSCKLRFGESAVLPFGGFPGVGLTR